MKKYLPTCSMALIAVCARAGDQWNAWNDIAADLLADPPGVDRGALMPQVDRQIVVFLKKHLLP
jgi:hypothetical protein